MKVGSICSGIEAASVAWRPLGMEFDWFSEIADFPSQILKAKYPDKPNLGDMNDIPKKIRVFKFLGGFCKKKGGRHHPFSIRKKVVTGFGKCTGFNTFIAADGSAATNFLTVTAMFKVVKTI